MNDKSIVGNLNTEYLRIEKGKCLEKVWNGYTVKTRRLKVVEYENVVISAKGQCPMIEHREKLFD